jgi:hypothetical protein
MTDSLTNVQESSSSDEDSDDNEPVEQYLDGMSVPEAYNYYEERYFNELIDQICKRSELTQEILFGTQMTDTEDNDKQIPPCDVDTISVTVDGEEVADLEDIRLENFEQPAAYKTTYSHSWQGPDDTVHRFESWQDIYEWVTQGCDEGLSLDALKDACEFDIDMSVFKGFIEQVDGNAGVTCDSLTRIARYQATKKERED